MLYKAHSNVTQFVFFLYSFLLNQKNIQKKEEESKPEPIKESKKAVAAPEKTAGDSKKSKAKPSASSEPKAAKATQDVVSESKKNKGIVVLFFSSTSNLVMSSDISIYFYYAIS